MVRVTPLALARKPTLDFEAGLHLGFILNREPPQVGHEFGLVSLEVGVVKIQVGGVVPRALAAQRLLCLLEAVQVELPDEAGEIVGLKAVVLVDSGVQKLNLEELLVDDDQVTVAVPADGPDLRTIHQTPEFSRKKIGVHGLLHGVYPEVETGKLRQL